jgi:hypothetical protein
VPTTVPELFHIRLSCYKSARSSKSSKSSKPFDALSDTRPYTAGPKSALLQVPGNPVVMVTDTTDVMFSCSESEIMERFESTGADVLLGGESQLWPEIKEYFDMEEEREEIDTRWGGAG